GLNNSPSVLQPTRVRVPKPKPFGGARIAKELENSFELWSTASSCPCPRGRSSEPNHHVLHRRCHALVENKGHRRRLKTFPCFLENLKELKEQLLPRNASWTVGKALRKLKHATVLVCVKQFSSLMLDINNCLRRRRLPLCG
ncbi:hypothetical protein AMTR_s00126p00075370, partial [Amborella trichopoda]